MPSQNTGSDTSTDVLNVTSTSQNEYRLTADMIPAAMPKIISMRMAATASLSVLGNLSHEDVGDRTALLIGVAQIALHQIAQVVAVLDDRWACRARIFSTIWL